MMRGVGGRWWQWLPAVPLAAGAAYGGAWTVFRTGCGSTAYSTVSVRATNAATGAALPPDLERRGLVLIRDGAFADSGSLAEGAGARLSAGRYRVTVRVPGYREWTAPGRAWVRYRNPCQLRPVVLRARLHPAR